MDDTFTTELVIISYVKIAEIINAEMKRRGISIREFARLVGVSHPTISDVLNGKKPYRFTIPTAKRNRAIILVLLDTGLRASELCRIRVQDVNLETGEILIRPWRVGKTRSRIVIIGKQTRKALWQYLAERSPDVSEFLFVTEDGKPMSRYTLCSLFNRLGKRAGVSGAHPHRFRHTFAIQYLRNGGDVFTLQRLLGHSTMEMVRRYLSLAQTDAADAHRRASPVDNWRL